MFTSFSLVQVIIGTHTVLADGGYVFMYTLMYACVVLYVCMYVHITVETC